MSENFDTQEATRRLQAAGMERPPAEAVTDVVRDSRDGLATQDGLDALRLATNTGMDALRLATEAGLKALGERIGAVNDRIDAVNDRIDAVRKETTTSIDALRREMTTSINAVNGRIDAFRWMVGLCFAVTLAMLGVILAHTL